MAPLHDERYLDALAVQSALFAESLRGADLKLPVPTCPEWTLHQLAEHVGRIIAEPDAHRQKEMVRSEDSFNLWQSILRGAGVITGCRRCADVCPVPDCITMVDELQFDNNDTLYPLYAQDRPTYNALLQKHGIPLHPELVEKAKKTAPVHQPLDYSQASPQRVPTVAGGEE